MAGPGWIPASHPGTTGTGSMMESKLHHVPNTRGPRGSIINLALKRGVLILVASFYPVFQEKRRACEHTAALFITIPDRLSDGFKHSIPVNVAEKLPSDWRFLG